jgi:hypothetical protein
MTYDNTKSWWSDKRTSSNFRKPDKREMTHSNTTRSMKLKNDSVADCSCKTGLMHPTWLDSKKKGN